MNKINYPTGHDSNMFILKQDINQWTNHYLHLSDYKVGHVLEILFKEVLYFLYNNNFKINCKLNEFWHIFVNFVYEHRAPQYSKSYYV